MISINKKSIFVPSEYRKSLGKLRGYVCQVLYTRIIFCKIGKTRWGGARIRIILMKHGFAHTYHDIISLENLIEAWREFIKGKRGRVDVQLFERDLMRNIVILHDDLRERSYRHGGYYPFNISDPKPRSIHKASVRDRLLHRALYRILYPFFDKTFIADSYSCRQGKGTHRALNRFRDLTHKESKNHTRTLWVLKCDIRKFFASVDQKILLDIVGKYIPDKEIVWLMRQVISSFYSVRMGVGLPLGNLTSQLFVNIYMNEFDQFMKHKLTAKYYIRYADDFVVLSRDKKRLEEILEHSSDFLWSRLKLQLHPNKVSIQTLASGVDFLGWVHFPNHRVLRTATKKRMFRNIKTKNCNEKVVESYLGLLSHGNGRKLKEIIQENF